MKRKKTVIIVLICILAILIIPIPSQLNDGGSIQYAAILYRVTKYHKINEQSASGYTDGIEVKILGFEVFNNCCESYNSVGTESNENNTELLNDGAIQFYNEPTAENKTVIIDQWATMSKEDLNLFLERIKNQKWVDDEIVDRLTHYYDCRISYGDFIYIGYDQKVIYYKKWFTELTDENAVLIKSYYPKDENSDVNGGEQDYFNGEVLAINDNSIKVKCLDVTKGDVTEGTKLNVTKDVVSANGVPSIRVGDTIRVVYTGIRETYPPQLQTVFAIYLVDESGKVIPNQ